LIGPVNGQPRPITPFAVVGGGLFRTNEQFLNVGHYSSTEGAFTAGGGVRALIGKHVFAGVEARVRDGRRALWRINMVGRSRRRKPRLDQLGTRCPDRQAGRHRPDRSASIRRGRSDAAVFYSVTGLGAIWFTAMDGAPPPAPLAV
jgi:hypothetical protein